MHSRTLGFTFLVALGCCAQAGAQGTPQDDVTEITFPRESPCVRASRIQSDVPCFEERTSIPVEVGLNVENRSSSEYFAVPTMHCQAVITLDYKQQNTLASVEGEVKNDTCGASSGSFVLSVRTSRDSGEPTTREFTQTWSRVDDQPVRFSAEYPIEEDVILVVRAQRVRCTCADAPR